MINKIKDYLSENKGNITTSAVTSVIVSTAISNATPIKKFVKEHKTALIITTLAGAITIGGIAIYKQSQKKTETVS
jgi:hypothetical protein